MGQEAIRSLGRIRSAIFRATSEHSSVTFQQRVDQRSLLNAAISETFSSSQRAEELISDRQGLGTPDAHPASRPQSAPIVSPVRVSRMSASRRTSASISLASGGCWWWLRR